MPLKSLFVPLILIILGFLLISGAVFYWNNLRGVWPAITPPSRPISDVINTTAMPLVLPPGFSIEIFAKDLPGVRVMEFDGMGNMWVSQPGEGTVTLLEIQNGKVIGQSAPFTNLRNPHGLAIDPNNDLTLYIAEEHAISRVPLYTEATLEKIADLPAGGSHYSRTIEFGPDGRLYVSIGSSCNVCREGDARRAAVLSMDKDGKDSKPFATGLRNAVFFDWHPVTRHMWATDMGRDLLGDDLPPDEVNIVTEGKFYGWPICYGKNVHDTDFDTNTYIRNPCMEPFEMPSHIDIPAHSAPLGLAFIPQGWPQGYEHDLLVAYHGSWNRSQPTGYKVVRFLLDEQGRVQGQEDFITGWLQGGQALGRPVDLLMASDGTLFISDDHAGVIYRVWYPDPV